MMLRVFLAASLLAAVAFADLLGHDIDDHFGCCSAEDRHEIQYLWESVWSSSFTSRKVAIARAIFEESVSYSSCSLLAVSPISAPRFPSTAPRAGSGALMLTRTGHARTRTRTRTKPTRTRTRTRTRLARTRTRT